MASTFSTNLKIELQATGENSNTWGTITNTNLGTALEQAIVGYGNPSYASDANLTLTYTDTNAAQTARALVLNVTSAVSLSTTRELVVPTIQKQYIVQNNTTGSQSITVKTSAGSGITVPSGRKAHLYVNGTDVIQMFDFVDINGGAIDGTTIGSGSAASGAFTTLSGTTLTLTNPLAVNQGGTGQTTYTNGQLLIGNTTGNTLTKSTLTAGSGVSITNGTGSITISATGSGGTVTSVDQTFTGGLISVSGAPITGAGTLALTVAGTSGGIPYFSSGTTWASSGALAANALVIGGGAGVAPSTTTTGTGVVTALGNAANATGGFTTINGTATLTNKRIDPRVVSAASASSLTPDVSAADMYAYTALAAGLTINAPIGTPVDGTKLMFRLLDNGTSRALTWNATYTPIGVTLPTATTLSKTTYVGCIYNANNTRWDVVAVTTQA